MNMFTPKPLSEQIETLRKHFPWLAEPKTEANPESVDGAEGLFAIPRWRAVAPTYNEAVIRILAVLGSTRPFRNWRDGKLGPEYLRRAERTDTFLARFGMQDILVVPAQLGSRHKGRSVEDVRATYAENEFGMGAFEVATMLLTHPERLTAYEDLWIDCPGDEYRFVASGSFGRTPYFSFNNGRVGFDTTLVSLFSERSGSASGCLPQSKLAPRPLDTSRSLEITVQQNGRTYRGTLNEIEAA